MCNESLSVRIALLEDPETKTVDFSTYEVIFDEAGKTFLAALVRAAERGVKVRGIIDRRIAKANPMLIRDNSGCPVVAKNCLRGGSKH